MSQKMIWNVDYTSFIRPELLEVIHHQANNSSLEHFREIWSPKLTAIKGMTLIFTEFYHKKYGKILQEKILLSSEDYLHLCARNPLFEFFDGEIETTFRGLIKRTVTDPYTIYLLSEGHPMSLFDSGSESRSGSGIGSEGIGTVGKAIRDSLEVPRQKD